MIRTFLYPVGWLEAWQKGRLRMEWKYNVHWMRAGNWRAVRNSFNGYLAEHDGCPHNAGRGWTRRAVLRRVERICAKAVPQ